MLCGYNDELISYCLCHLEVMEFKFFLEKQVS